MKLKISAFILLAVILLSACTFSLAEDITPPPNYVSPTPAPTLGPLYPAEAPNVADGAVIYAQKCAACHGQQGMGDGEQGKQLPVTVPAFALPQTARNASPADWFTTVTRGNMDRYMPPFTSLTDQQRWDVVAYALSIHATPEQVAQGQSVFQSACVNCPLDFFKDQSNMAALSDNALVQLLKNGSDSVTALKGDLSEDDLYAAAAYLRTLSFATSIPTPMAATVAPTIVGTEARTPSAEGTPLATETVALSTPEATGSGRVIGSINGTNVAGLTVTLHGYDHASDSVTGPQETVTLTTITDANGNYSFDGLDMPENRIYIADTPFNGVTYSSEAVTLTASETEVTLAPFTLYNTTTDFSTLAFNQVHFFFEISDGTAQVIAVYTFTNSGMKTITFATTNDVPFLKLPAGAQNVGFELTQDSAPLLIAGDGFAIQPSDTTYGIVAYYTLPYNGSAQFAQPFVLPADTVLVLVPDGVTAKSSQLTKGSVQSFQGGNYTSFSGGPLKSNDTLTIELSGMPKSTGSTSSSNSQQNLLIGIGVLGLVLVLAGVWMYLGERNRTKEELDEDENEFDSEEEIVDAIIALDDLHRAGKIPDEAYEERRKELKARLKS